MDLVLRKTNQKFRVQDILVVEPEWPTLKHHASKFKLSLLVETKKVIVRTGLIFQICMGMRCGFTNRRLLGVF